MTNEIMKFNYNSSHNNFPAIESLNSIDIGTERQFRFTTQMLCDMFQVVKNTIYNRIEILTNTGDLSVQNFEQIKIPDSNGRTHETTVYDLTVLNKLAMTMIDNPIAVNVRKAFNDVIVQVETTGQYNVKDMPKSLPEALRAYADAIEAKEQADKECERQRLIAEEAIKRRAQIGAKREATAMNTASRLSKENTKLKDELADTTEKLDQANVDNDILKTQLEIAKSSMLTNKRVCEMLRDRFEISLADSTLKSRTSKALQSIANEFGENIVYDKQFVDGVLRKVPYYTQHTADILMQRLAYDCAYLRQF